MDVSVFQPKGQYGDTPMLSPDQQKNNEESVIWDTEIQANSEIEYNELCYYSQEPQIIHRTSSACTSELQGAYAMSEPPLHYGKVADEDDVTDRSCLIEEEDEEQQIEKFNDGTLVNIPEIGGTFMYDRN